MLHPRAQGDQISIRDRVTYYREIRFRLEIELHITKTARVYIATTLPELGRKTSAQYTK